MFTNNNMPATRVFSWGRKNDDDDDNNQNQQGQKKGRNMKNVINEINKHLNDKNKKISDTQRAYLEKLKKNEANLSPEQIYDEFQKETKDSSFGLEVVKKILSDNRFKNLKHRTALEGLGKDISRQLEFFKSRSDSVSNMLEQIVNEIVKDKVKLRTMEEERMLVKRDMEEMNTKFNNMKRGYQNLLKDNEDLMSLNRELIDDNERTKTDLNLKDQKNKQYEELTKKIFDSRGKTERKIQRMAGMLDAIDGAMGRQLTSFGATETIDPNLLNVLEEDMQGGSAKNHMMEKGILKKIDSDDQRDIELLSAFYNLKFKTKSDMHTLLFALGIEFTLKDTKKDMLNKVIKKTKKLSKKEVNYLKKLL